MKKTLFTFISITAISFSAFAQNVEIPDANFKAALLANNAINTDSDPLNISIAEANAFNGSINVSQTNITTLVGIEAFTKITYLNCSSNGLLNLDVRNNRALTYLNCANNPNLIQGLTSLDLSKNKNLTELLCYGNSITSLDLSKNTALTNLDCSRNQLISLDVSKNKNLTKLQCSMNGIASLDLRKNNDLTELNCSTNRLSSLDVSNNLLLANLDCIGNTKITCIKALNSQDKTSWHKDAAAHYSENCESITDFEDIIITQPKTIANIYNIHGQEVSKYYSGLVIYKYTDGTSEKVVQE